MTGKSTIKKSLVIRLLAKFIKIYSKEVNAQSNLMLDRYHTDSMLKANERIKFSTTPIEIYFCYPDRGEKINYRSFFERHLENLEHIISGQPIFLERKHAIRYCRFMGHAHSILKAYVEDSAIESSSQELFLRQGFLNKELIHGCYPLNQLGKKYVTNPWFNRELLLQ